MSERREGAHLLAVAMLAVGAMLAVVVVLMVLRLGDRVESTEAEMRDLAAAYEKARERQPGLPPAEDIVEGVELPPSVQGERGPAGRDGRDAVAVDGIDGRDGADGFTPPCYFLPTQCVGADGRDGVDGTDGRDGADGADSTVPGPKGDQGDPGAPCPEGYSWQPDTLKGDEVLVCTKDAP